MTTTNHPLDAFQGPLRTRVGAARGGEYAIFRGQDIHRDLADMNWVEMYMFGVTGRRWSEMAVRVISRLLTYTSYPDSRIWNNRVAALSGSSRSTGGLAISAALATSEAAVYGGQTFFRALSFLLEADAYIKEGGELVVFVTDYLAQNRSIGGYGRPLTEKDERVAPALAMLAKEGLDGGHLLGLAWRVESILKAGRWRYRMNYTGLAAGACGDLGMTPREFYLVAYPAFLAGMGPCYLEALEKPAGAIMPFSCNSLNYVGSVARDWSERG